MTECIFCRIASGEIPSAKVYEDENVIAFLDIAPATSKGGHTLVIPKQHYETIEDIPKGTLCNVIDIVQKISKTILKRADGVNILQNNGKAAGQLVPHIHFHVMPRYDDDDVSISWTPKKYSEGEMEKVRQEIKKLLNDS